MLATVLTAIADGDADRNDDRPADAGNNAARVLLLLLLLLLLLMPPPLLPPLPPGGAGTAKPEASSDGED